MLDVPSELCQFLRDKLVVKSDLAVDMINIVYQHEDLDSRLWRYFDETSFNWIRKESEIEPYDGHFGNNLF